MICQFVCRINTILKLFQCAPLDVLYEKFISSVRARRIGFYLPSSDRYCKGEGYILWGFYTRECIIDLQPVKTEDGSVKWRKNVIRDFQIQRIMDTEERKTHALLSEILIPYKQYSLRYVLVHLRNFFWQHVTQEEYCLRTGIETKTLSAWLKWLKDHICLLFELGLTESYQDNWKAMRQCVQNLSENIYEWTNKSLRRLNLALFQERRMPANTVYRNYVFPG